jgi:signal transduction histidine kinase
VTDNGIGIDPRIKDSLFRVHLTTKDKGHGYGLVTCARIIENHKARIQIDSTPGAGATFAVTLPLDDIDSPPPE